MSRQYHDLKIMPEYFNAIAEGRKNFEVRYNDRGFQVNDILRLREHTGEEYTGRVIETEVTYLLDDKNYCKEGYVVMAIKLIS
ncbi:MAG: DUF3850 domain-containing protein [Bacteroidales bacterium]|nr:DUF3850 domain-containing protein [Bacteroidales bacterium]